MDTFPVLFGKAVGGKIKQWSIKVLKSNDHGIIETEYGYIDGKKQSNQRIITKGKNIGKANGTDAVEQAISEAKTLWIKKKQSGYYESDEGTSSSVVIENNSKETNDSIPDVMLAHEYSKHSSKIIFPCFIQPKLDGTRCVAIPNDGLYTRNKKKYSNLDYILDEIKDIGDDVILDGELYSDQLTFQEIIGITKKELKKNVSDKKVDLYVYDIIIERPYEERIQILNRLFKENDFKYLKLLKTEICENTEFIKQKHDEYINEKYEGVMIRNSGCKYENKRSYNLQKYKEFFDKEYEIINFTEGKGLEKGCVIWICKSENNKQFSCRPCGTRDERKELYKNGIEYIGKYLTVKYQCMTDDGLPRFPVGLSIRDYE